MCRRDQLDEKVWLKATEENYRAAYDEALASDFNDELKVFIYGVNPKTTTVDEFVAEALCQPPFQTFAMLLADQPVAQAVMDLRGVKDFPRGGLWLSEGDMGWFGASETKDNDWPVTFAAVLKALPPSAWLTVLDLHI